MDFHLFDLFWEDRSNIELSFLVGLIDCSFLCSRRSLLLFLGIFQKNSIASKSDNLPNFLFPPKLALESALLFLICKHSCSSYNNLSWWIPRISASSSKQTVRQVFISLISANSVTFKRFFESCELSYHWSFQIYLFLCWGVWEVHAVGWGWGRFLRSLFEFVG